jgi:hypothetical protein
MMENIKMKNFFCGLLNILNPGIAKFDNLVTIGADQVIVLLVTIRFLVLGQVLAKLVLTHQVALHQQVEGVVNRCPAYAVILILHADV